MRVLISSALVSLFVLGCATLPRAGDYLEPARLEWLVSAGSVDYTLLDVRTPEEYSLGHIPTARNLPVDQIREDTVQLAKQSMIIVYCASGARAAVAADRLRELGFTNVGDFGSIRRWRGELTTAS